MKPRLSFNHLNAFAVAAEHLSFQKAAKLLHVTPSAVSHQVRSLEAVLGYALFDRIDKGVRLTDRGRELFDGVDRPLRQLHDVSHAALHSEEETALSVSAAPVLATRWLLPRLSSFRRANPEVSVSVIATADLLDFAKDNIDCAVRIGNGNWDGALAELLFRPAVVAICNPAMLEANGKPFSPEELILKKRVDNLGMPDLWGQWFSAAGISVPVPAPVLQVQSAAQVLEAIQADDCVGLFDLNLIRSEVGDGTITPACSFKYDAGDSYYLVRPKNRDESHVVQLFKSWLHSQTSDR